jgi:uncharacterized Zn finger protein
VTGEFGTTVWGRDWVRLAEPTAISRPDPTLPRARSLTRRDAVRDLSFAAGSITATVHERAEHPIRIDLPIWTPADQSRASAAIADQPAGGDLSDSVHATLRDEELDVAPDPSTLAANCDCASRRRPCLHLLTTYYEVARRLDERPRLALALRGVAETIGKVDTARIPLASLDATTFYSRPTGSGDAPDRLFT